MLSILQGDFKNDDFYLTQNIHLITSFLLDKTSFIQIFSFFCRPIFSTSSEFCMLMVKFVDQCKEQEKVTSLDENGYPHICPNMTQLRPLIKDAIKRSNIQQALLRGGMAITASFGVMAFPNLCENTTPHCLGVNLTTKQPNCAKLTNLTIKHPPMWP